MTTTVLLGSLLAGVGVALAACGLVIKTRQSERELAELLGVPLSGVGASIVAPTGDPGQVVNGTLRLAKRAVDRFDPAEALRTRIQLANLSLRPAELVVISTALSFAAAMAVYALTGMLLAAAVVTALTPLAVRSILDVLAARRARRFTAQLPDALSLVASSMSAGHTFLRAIQMMAVEYDQPLSDEFQRVVSETQLGSPLVEALERMGTRLDIRDVDWLVQAIRIQQSVGGHLADLLMTLAEFMRARDELRREVNVLTAEGRMSAYVLGAMPVLLFATVQVINPDYMEPMLQGWGIVWLGLTALSMAAGLTIILRMVKAVEV